MEISAPELSASIKPYDEMSGQAKRRQLTQMDLCPRLGDGTKVIDHVSLGHADATIAEGEDLIVLVWSYADEELLLGIEDGGISEGGVANFVKSIGTIRDEFTEENFLVGVESI
jgi:hypothetical protein